MPRMTMLHAWIWLENPAGMFPHSDWSVPYLRLGMTPASDPGNAVAGEHALASGGTAYFFGSRFMRQFRSRLQKGKRSMAPLHARVPLWRPGSANIRGLPPHPQVWIRLSTVWKSLWRDIDSSVGHQARQSLQLVPVR